MRLFKLLLVLLPLASLAAGCHSSGDADKEKSESTKQRNIEVTSPGIQDVTVYRDYVCQIHSRQHIEVSAIESGYLESIEVSEGQAVKEGQVMFRILPILKKANLDAQIANANLAQIDFDNAKNLNAQNVVSDQEVKLAQAKLDNAKAQVELARSQLEFMDIKAAFSGKVDRQLAQKGRLINEGDLLTTLSDNEVMWVYFNVPEARYLEYQETPDFAEKMELELQLANLKMFPEKGKIGAIETDFNNKTGNIAFRGDFPNPKNILRNGQTGTIKIPTHLKDAIVIPQRATFSILDRRYVYVIENDSVVRQREITVAEELEDIFVIGKGLTKDDKFVLEGVRQVRDGDKIKFKFRDPKEVLSTLKNRAE